MESKTTNWVKVTLIGIASLVFVLVACFGLVFLAGAVGRYQDRADASNKVSVTATGIKNAQQQKRVEQIQADIKYIQATGVKRAQDEIDKTLTPLYVQWEAIQAEFALANSPSNTTIYIPVGANGVPLVSTTGLQKVQSGG